MNKKKLLLLGLVIIVLLIAVGFGAWQFFFKGVAPAITPPKADIADIIESQPKSSPDLEGDPVSFPLNLPEGFKISIFAKGVTNARVLKFDPSGNLLVSQPSQGRVTALIDENQDGKTDRQETVASGLNRPHGLAFQDNKIFIAETDQVARYDYQNFKATGKKTLFNLPSGGNHFSRTIEVGPDGKIYTTIGSSCNVCVEKDHERATMMVANADGSDLQTFATGLRNTVFFVTHPETKKWWGTDMGRDLIGDNIPPDDVNIIEKGRDYGWPYCYGNRVHDNQFDKSNSHSCTNTVAPIYEIPAHSAPLGLAFVPTAGFPNDWQGDLLVSYHGSWNRSVPTGYKIVRLKVDGEKITGAEDFISGWLDEGSSIGRPVDLVFDKSGHLYASDDKAGVVYLISYD